MRALRTELEREREINRRLADERDAPEEELGVYKERAAALRDALEQATRDAEKECDCGEKPRRRSMRFKPRSPMPTR